MKIERQEKEFTPIVITIETREELEHLFAAIWSHFSTEYDECKEHFKLTHYYNAKVDEEIRESIQVFLND